VTEKFLELQGDNRQYVKMLLKIDDYIARAFFAKKIIIVEGDTEDVVMRKTLDVLDKSSKNKIKSDVQIIKARGKATIPPLVKYFKALGIENLFVIHDKDEGVKVAEDVNPRILEALGDENNRIMLEQCIEDVLEYDVPSSDKPFKAFIQIENWKTINDLPEKWKNIIENIFRNYLT
jgi:predicted ATP-dependent endonuclease of OLD family